MVFQKCRHPTTPKTWNEVEKKYDREQIKQKNFSDHGYFMDDGRWAHYTLNFLPVTPDWCPIKVNCFEIEYQVNDKDSF